MYNLSFRFFFKALSSTDHALVHAHLLFPNNAMQCDIKQTNSTLIVLEKVAPSQKKKQRERKKWVSIRHPNVLYPPIPPKPPRSPRSNWNPLQKKKRKS